MKEEEAKGVGEVLKRDAPLKPKAKIKVKKELPSFPKLLFKELGRLKITGVLSISLESLKD